MTSSQMPDAQAGYEALMTLLPTFLAGANWVMHAAGWLEGGLVACYEKFVIDIELLQMMREEFTPLEIDEASLAFDAHTEVGHGGHFLGAMHTMERFRTCFYRPLLSSSENYERWMRGGGSTPPAGRSRSTRSGWPTTSSRLSTTPSARSSRSTSYGAAPSSATDPAPATSQRKTTVRPPCRRTRLSACQRTARESTWHSTSRPAATSSGALSVWSTRTTSCSMIGPSSSSGVT